MAKQISWLFEAPVSTQEKTSCRHCSSQPEFETVVTACPDTTICRFPRYQNTVRALPREEQVKIEQIARQIAASHNPGSRPVISIQLIGHADRDFQRGPAFERKISLERAQTVRQALMEAVNRQKPNLATRISWLPTGVGATNLVVLSPINEVQRSFNRRVVINTTASSTPIPVPRTERQIMDDAVAASRNSLRLTIASLTSLETGIIAGLINRPSDPLALIHKNTIDGLRDRLKINLGDANYLDTLRQARRLLERNLAIPPKVNKNSTNGPTCQPTDFARSLIGRPDRDVSVCNNFFNKGPNCQRDVITHEFFHLLGLDHQAAPLDTRKALQDPNSLSQLVSQIVSGRSDACTRNND